MKTRVISAIILVLVFLPFLIIVNSRIACGDIGYFLYLCTFPVVRVI